MLCEIDSLTSVPSETSTSHTWQKLIVEETLFNSEGISCNDARRENPAC